MPGRTVELLFPIKGVTNQAPRNEQPEHTVPPEAMVNMLPYGRTGRLSGAQRPGLSRLYASAFAGPGNVQSLNQFTLALDPNSVTPTALSANDDFTYAPGTLSAMAPATWYTSGLTNYGYGPTPQTSITTNGTTVNPGILGQTGGALYLPTLPTGGSYTLRASISLQSNTTATGCIGAALAFRLDTAGKSATKGWSVWFQRANIRLKRHSDNNPATDYASFSYGSALSAGFHTCEVQVSGETVYVRVDGTLYATFTMDGTDAGNAGVGFAATENSISEPVLDWWQVYTATQAASYRQTNLVAVSQGTVYVGTNTVTAVAATGGTGALNVLGRPSLTGVNGTVYMVDGTVLKSLNLTTATVGTVTATAGSLPTGCTLAATYRGRLCLAAPVSSPQNFFFSRVGTPTDWDYGQTDVAAAFAGNASTAGRIGEPITALIPFNDDEMLIGGDHNLWMIRGDPADGGSIDLLSDAVGVLGPTAWCKTPEGAVYLAGTGGLFRVSPGGAMENVSKDLYNDFFRSINRGTSYVNLAWDRDRQGCFIFVTPVNGGATTHLWYDHRQAGFFPVQFPANMDPISALVYDGDGPNDRALYLGGRDGLIRKRDTAAFDDDGTAITASVSLGPVQPFDVTTEGKLTHLDLVMGDAVSGASSYGATLTVANGHDAAQALASPQHSTARTFTAPGRATRWLQRSRGVSYFFTLANSTAGRAFTCEKLVAFFMPAGRERR